MIWNTKIAGKAEEHKSRNRSKWKFYVQSEWNSEDALWLKPVRKTSLKVGFGSEYKKRSLGTIYSTCILSIMANRSEVWGRDLTQIQKGTWVWQLHWYSVPAVFTHPSSLLYCESWLCSPKTRDILLESLTTPNSLLHCDSNHKCIPHPTWHWSHWDSIQLQENCSSTLENKYTVNK